jgi:hypothetical protein
VRLWIAGLHDCATSGRYLPASYGNFVPNAREQQSAAVSVRFDGTVTPVDHCTGARRSRIGRPESSKVLNDGFAPLSVRTVLFVFLVSISTARSQTAPAPGPTLQQALIHARSRFFPGAACEVSSSVSSRPPPLEMRFTRNPFSGIRATASDQHGNIPA